MSLFSAFSATARSRGIRLTLAALFLAMVGSVAQIQHAAPAHALCASSPMVGDWHNINGATRSMTRVVVDFTCSDVVLCPVGQPCTGGDSYFTLRGYGACTPTACDWGSRRATSMADGWQRATYSYGWATKYLWVKTYAYYGLTYLRVYTFTDFTDGRTDYSTDEWMLR